MAKRKKPATRSRRPKAKRKTTALATVRPRPKRIARSTRRASTALPDVKAEALGPTLTAGLAAQGLSRAHFSATQIDALLAPYATEQYDILPSGEVYVSQIHQRARLNRVFGPGRWGMDPRTTARQETGRNLVAQYWALMVDGTAVAVAMGEGKYKESNKRDSWPRALEGAKSNAIMRCCKDLGMAAECWDRKWAYRFRLKCGVFVIVKDSYGDSSSQWRALDAPPIVGETGTLDARSPNRKKYVPPDAVMRSASSTRRVDVDDEREAAARAKADAGPGRALIPASDAPIPKQALGQIKQIQRAMNVDDATLLEYLKAKLNIDSTTKIKRSQFNAVCDWLKAPDTPSDEPVDGEVVP